MAVAPDRLNGIAAHFNNAFELEGRWPERLLRPFVECSHDVALAFAASAGAGSPQLLQWNKAFPGILPFDGQFRTDLLQIRRLHIKAALAVDNRLCRPVVDNSGRQSEKIHDRPQGLAARVRLIIARESGR